ncbi:hypothetical protein K9L97_03595 [Candidatus Woesearchaeota archaeon]|nr:hypothetical protein [Candidatus Woesearchaeota archaeon]
MARPQDWGRKKSDEKEQNQKDKDIQPKEKNNKKTKKETKKETTKEIKETTKEEKTEAIPPSNEQNINTLVEHTVENTYSFIKLSEHTTKIASNFVELPNNYNKTPNISEIINDAAVSNTQNNKFDDAAKKENTYKTKPQNKNETGQQDPINIDDEIKRKIKNDRTISDLAKTEAQKLEQNENKEFTSSIYTEKEINNGNETNKNGMSEEKMDEKRKSLKELLETIKDYAAKTWDVSKVVTDSVFEGALTINDYVKDLNDQKLRVEKTINKEVNQIIEDYNFGKINFKQAIKTGYELIDEKDIFVRETNNTKVLLNQIYFSAKKKIKNILGIKTKETNLEEKIILLEENYKKQESEESKEQNAEMTEDTNTKDKKEETNTKSKTSEQNEPQYNKKTENAEKTKPSWIRKKYEAAKKHLDENYKGITTGMFLAGSLMLGGQMIRTCIDDSTIYVTEKNQESKTEITMMPIKINEKFMIGDKKNKMEIKNFKEYTQEDLEKIAKKRGLTGIYEELTEKQTKPEDYLKEGNINYVAGLAGINLQEEKPTLENKINKKYQNNGINDIVTKEDITKLKENLNKKYEQHQQKIRQTTKEIVKKMSKIGSPTYQTKKSNTKETKITKKLEGDKAYESAFQEPKTPEQIYSNKDSDPITKPENTRGTEKIKYAKTTKQIPEYKQKNEFSKQKENYLGNNSEQIKLTKKYYESLNKEEKTDLIKVIAETYLNNTLQETHKKLSENNIKTNNYQIYSLFNRELGNKNFRKTKKEDSKEWLTSLTQYKNTGQGLSEKLS